MTADSSAPVLSGEDFSKNPQLTQIRDLIYQVAGIFQADNKLRFLDDRCSKRMQVLGVKSLREYYECLTIKPIRQTELVNLLNEITIGETCFFRNQPQLDAVRNVAIPQIMEAKAKLPMRTLKIWSAGCSTGEEPYTLAMLLLEETAGRLKDWKFEIIATDLNERSVGHAKSANYGDYSTRNLTPYYEQKYFAEHNGTLHVLPEVQAHINFSRLNLLDDARMAFLKGMDIILCCNVLIYFDGASKRRVIQHFYNNLLPHGYFFLGHSESLYGISEEFRLVHMPAATAYVKCEKRQLIKQVGL
jgi:chemotaxis protein methyltransferase CheR